jgi:hypothetical protein
MVSLPLMRTKSIFQVLHKNVFKSVSDIFICCENAVSPVSNSKSSKERLVQLEFVFMVCLSLLWFEKASRWGIERRI